MDQITNRDVSDGIFERCFVLWTRDSQRGIDDCKRREERSAVCRQPVGIGNAGQPVRDPVGTICLADHVPRETGASDLEKLVRFGRLIECELLPRQKCNRHFGGGILNLIRVIGFQIRC